MKPSRKALAVFLSFIIVFSACAGMGASAFAAAAVIGSGTCGKNGDNLTWTLTDDGVLTISGTGEMADYLDYHFLNASDIIFESAPWEECKDRVLAAPLGFDSMEEARVALKNGEQIDLAAYTAAVRENLTFFKRVVIEEGVTSIGGRALDGMYLTSVSLPSTLKKIGEYALCGNRLTEITLPEGLKQIGESALVNNKLTELTIPSTVETITGDLIRANDGLRTVTLRGDLQPDSLGLPAFYESILFDSCEDYLAYQKLRMIETYYPEVYNLDIDVTEAKLRYMYQMQMSEADALLYAKANFESRLAKIRDRLGLPADATPEQMLAFMHSEINNILGASYAPEELFIAWPYFLPSPELYLQAYARYEQEQGTDHQEAAVIINLLYTYFGPLYPLVKDPDAFYATFERNGENDLDESIPLFLAEMEEDFGIVAATPAEAVAQIVARVNEFFGTTGEDAFTAETLGTCCWHYSGFNIPGEAAVRARYGLASNQESIDLYWVGQVRVDNPDYPYIVAPWITLRVSCDNPYVPDIVNSDVNYELIHDGETRTVQAPTCVEPGIGYVECSKCGGAEVTIPATGIHTPQEVAATEATATEHGFTAGVVCADCGATISGHEIVHNTLGARTVLAEPTQDSEGEAIIVCTVCGESGLYAIEKLPPAETSDEDNNDNVSPLERIRKAINSFVDWVLRLIRWLGRLQG